MLKDLRRIKLAYIIYQERQVSQAEYFEVYLVEALGFLGCSIRQI